MADLLTAYPDLGDAISRLSGGRTWRFTGASALLLDATHLYLEITKPRHWRRLADGTSMAGIGAIGGSLEGDEGVLACLRREVHEEIGAPVALLSANATHLVYEQRTIETLPQRRGVRPDAPVEERIPAPVLCTVSGNLYRREALPDAQVLAIATFWATLAGPPRLGDLFGLLAVPLGALGEVLGAPLAREDVRQDARVRHPSVEAVRSIPGVRLETRRPMEEGTLLEPVWTARSLQILVQAGRLRLPSSGRISHL